MSGFDQQLVLRRCCRRWSPPTASRRLGDDLRRPGIGLHLLLEALLDVEGVGVAGIAQDLQHLALGVALLLLEQALDLAGGDIADLDRAGDRGQVELASI